MNRSQAQEVKFFSNDVHLFVAGPYKVEAPFVGKLLMIKQSRGISIEWHPVGKCDSPEDTTDPEPLDDWEEVMSPTVVSFKGDQEGSFSDVKFKPAPRFPNPVLFKVCDLKSYRQVELPGKQRIGSSFYLKDGSNIPAFYFEPDVFIAFMDALGNYVRFQQSKQDKSLYLIKDLKEEALAKSFSELRLFGESKSHVVSKFFQDPYSTAMGGISKVTNFLLDYLMYSNDSAPPPWCSDEQVAELLTEGLSHINISQDEEHGFEVISSVELPPRPIVKRSHPVSSEEWLSHIDKDGIFHDVDELKKRIFKGGLTESLRPEAWKFLLGYYSFNSTAEDRVMVKRQKHDDYYRMKQQWQTMTDDQLSKFAAFRDRKSLIDKDIVRTDPLHPYFEGENKSNVMDLYDILMTYCMYNFDFGYVQGMSDLLSPIQVVVKSQQATFWCFAGWLERVGANFEMDQQGMKTQLMNLRHLMYFVDSKFCSYLESHESGNLLFCFRWLLILFKRDFTFDEVMRLWEVLWTDLPCKNFHLLICIAILDTEKLTIMENNYGLAEILKHINDLSYNIDLETTLCKAEAIYRQIKSSCHLSGGVQKILGLNPT